MSQGAKSKSAQATGEQITPGEQSSGVILVAFGNRIYYFQAVHLAFSIKHFNPGINITLHVDDLKAFERHILPSKRLFFSNVVEFGCEFSSPAEVKLNMDKFCTYHRNLFLDTDTLAVGDIAPIFKQEQDTDYAVHLNGIYLRSQENKFPQMMWMQPEQVYEHFKLKDDAVLYSTNSSVQYLRKSKTVNKIFGKAREYFADAVPLDKLRRTWGNSQPDELYLNAALSSLEMPANFAKPPVYFPVKNDIAPYQVKETYPLMSYFGPRGNVPVQFTMYMDSWLAQQYANKGLAFAVGTRVSDTLKHKFANTKRQGK